MWSIARPLKSINGAPLVSISQSCRVPLRKNFRGERLATFSFAHLNLLKTRQYSTFNAHSSGASSSSSGKKKEPMWPKIKAFTTFTVSGALIIGATGLSAIVIYLIGAELFSPSGDTQIFNRSVSMIEKDQSARSLLQCEDSHDKKERLKAYGETFTNDKWTRNRPISSSKKVDRNGKAHYYMRFHVESKKKRGLVHVEAIESETHFQPDFSSMYIDIPGEKRHYLIKPKLHKVVKPNGFLGVNWGPKRN